MKANDDLFGLYIPTGSVLHRVPAGPKLAGLLVFSIVLLFGRTPPLAVGGLVVAMGVLALTGVPWKRAFAPGWLLVVTLAVLFAAQVWWGKPHEGVVLVANILACIYASRVVTFTTPAPALLDALVAASRPLRVIGVDPERVGLAVALMIRSVPYLLGSFDEVRDAARARGIERNIVAQVTPVVIGAVAYAQRTGEALAARGLGEGED